MANEFDPYREALVVEQRTIWPEQFDDIELADRAALEEKLHAAPEEAAELVYERTHTGFCREITVTEIDLQRVRAAAT